MVAGILCIAKYYTMAFPLLFVACVFMMLTRDNAWIKSDISAIKREGKDMARHEGFCRDVSLIGVALILLGGMGSGENKPAEVEKDKEE